MDRLLANGAGLPGLSEPGVHTAAVIGMCTGEYPQLVTIHILIQADGTDIVLVSLLIVMRRNLFKLFFRQSVPLEPFPVLDTTNYHHCSHGQNQQSHNPCERDEVITQWESTVRDQKHPSPLLVDKEGTQVLGAPLPNKHRRDPDLLLDFLTIPHHVQKFIGIHIVYHGCTIPSLLSIQDLEVKVAVESSKQCNKD